MNLAINITDWIFLLSMIAALFISLFHREKKELFPIQLYIIILLLFNSVLKTIEILPKNNSSLKFENALINIFSIFEISIFYYFLFKRISGKVFHIIMKIFISIYFALCLRTWIPNPTGFFSYGPALFGIQGLFITIPCLFYIYEILKSDLEINLNADANFVAACGILFYSSITIPTYFSWYNLYYLTPGFDKIFIMSNSVIYTLLILTFMKAYLCPITDQKE